MSELIVAVLKIGFLVLMWIFILSAVQVIRTDMSGRQMALAADTGEVALNPPRAKRHTKRGAGHILHVVEGRQTGVAIPMAGVVGIGRADDSALQIDDDYASTRHAQLMQDAKGHWVLEDLHSTNGTLLNDAPVMEAVRVRVGDRIRIGHTLILVDKA